jgi:hypothetical protein
MLSVVISNLHNALMSKREGKLLMISGEPSNQSGHTGYRVSQRDLRLDETCLNNYHVVIRDEDIAFLTHRFQYFGEFEKRCWHLREFAFIAKVLYHKIFALLALAFPFDGSQNATGIRNTSLSHRWSLHVCFLQVVGLVDWNSGLTRIPPAYQLVSISFHLRPVFRSVTDERKSLVQLLSI